MLAYFGHRARKDLSVGELLNGFHQPFSHALELCARISRCFLRAAIAGALACSKPKTLIENVSTRLVSPMYVCTFHRTGCPLEFLCRVTPM
jgi:hypothetical protein